MKKGEVTMVTGRGGDGANRALKQEGLKSGSSLDPCGMPPSLPPCLGSSYGCLKQCASR